MAVIAFNEWAPDAADFGNPGAIIVKNSVPGVNSYKPQKSLTISTDALDARPRGAIEGIDSAENVFQYAGNETKLYSLSGGIWGDVSQAPYVTAVGERWEFVRWKEKIIATNFSDDPQSITFGGVNFADLTTDFKARHVGVVRDFVVFGYTNDGVDGTVRDRVRWSAINDETDYTVSAVTLSDFRDLKKGGIQAVVGGEYGVIVAEDSTFRMTFVGSPTIFQIDETLPGFGTDMPGGVVRLGDVVLFPSTQGFVAVRGGASIDPIGAGRTDDFFRNDLDTDFLDRVSSVADPVSKRVYWAYPGAGNSGGTPNRIIVYDLAFNKWGFVEVETELVWRSGGTATTLEQLDDLNLGAELVTNGDFATDTIWTKGTGWTIAAGVATHAAGSASDLSQAVAITQDVYYRLEFDVTGRTAGSVTPKVGDTSGTAISADASDIKESIRSGAGTDVTFSATSDFDGSIDNVSLKDIDDLDSMTVSLDSAEFKGDSPLLAAFDTTFKNGNFTGVPYDATFETREVELNVGHRTKLNAVLPLIDGGTITGRIASRQTQTETVTYTSTLSPRPSGIFTKRVNARYHRFEVTVTGDWKDSIGIQIDRGWAPKGERRG